ARKNGLNNIFLLLGILLLFPTVHAFAQIPRAQIPKVSSSEDNGMLRMRPICETEERLYKKYANYTAQDLVKELLEEDSTFECIGIRGTRLTLSKRGVIQSLILQDRDAAFPYLIKLVKKEKQEFSALALELVQHADDRLLREHRNLFIKKSTSENNAERNRSLHILKRIRDEHIEEVIVKRWNNFSDKEIETLAKSGSVRILCELMMYGVKNRPLIEESILHTLRDKNLKTNSLPSYLNVLSSFVSREHNTEIDDEVFKILMRTRDANVGNYAGDVLNNSRTAEGRNYLIQALDHKDEMVRAEVAIHLISRYDFDLIEDQLLLKRMFSDESPEVFRFAQNGIGWKKPNPEQNAVLVQLLLDDLSQEKEVIPYKVSAMMRYYGNLNGTMRESLRVLNLTSVLKAITVGLNSNDYRRAIEMSSQFVFKQVTGKKEMDITYLEFWTEQLEK
ncbi:MAG: HEAT repeat domain-containing protein, partial [Crocinitomicaceae bacterium]